MIKFIYFDLGKVVFDHNRVFEKLAIQFGFQEKELMNEFIRYKEPLTIGKLTPQEFWNRVNKDLGIANGEGFDFVGYWVNQYSPRKEVHQCMRVLQDKYKIGLLSNIYKDMWPLLKTKGIVPDIEYSSAILSCDAGFGKPSEAIYELALKSAGVKPNEILYVDDKGINLAPAQQAGWNIVPFNMLYPSKTVSLIYSLVEKL